MVASVLRFFCGFMFVKFKSGFPVRRPALVVGWFFTWFTGRILSVEFHVSEGQNFQMSIWRFAAHRQFDQPPHVTHQGHIT